MNLPVTISGSPKPTVTWQIKDKDVVQTGAGSVSTQNGAVFFSASTQNGDTTLTVVGVSCKDSGSYKVKAVNKVGEAEAEFTVVVLGT